jgi:hypothetical protein
MTNLGLFEKIMFGLLALTIIAAGFALARFDDRVNQCEVLGGTMVKTPDGWVCFKMVRIEKTT